MEEIKRREGKRKAERNGETRAAGEGKRRERKDTRDVKNKLDTKKNNRNIM